MKILDMQRKSSKIFKSGLSWTEMKINGGLNKNSQTNEQINDIWKNIKSSLENESIKCDGIKQPNSSQLAEMAQLQSFYSSLHMYHILI